MYLTVQIEAIPDKLEHEHDLSKGTVDPFSVLPMSEFAYLRDLTERGEDVDPTDVARLIHFQPQQTSEDNQQNQTTTKPPDPST